MIHFQDYLIKRELKMSLLSLLIKGLGHPKMKILSLFTHPHVVPNPYVLYTKEDIWKNVLIKQISFPIDYHGM